MEQCLSFLGCSMVVLLLAGCQSVVSEEPNPRKPFAFPGQNQPLPAAAPQNPAPVIAAPAPRPIDVAATAPAPDLSAPQPGHESRMTAPANPTAPPSAFLRPGDLVIVDFYDLPVAHAIPEYRDRIRDDGRLSLPHNVSVVAAGRTVGQLQEDIQSAYVPALFVRLTVSVKTEERFFYVGGEVRSPSRTYYQGEMTVLRAIDTVGGFTDFANRKTIELRRANGQKLKVNWNKAINDPKLDLSVFPNDQITVHKKWW